MTKARAVGDLEGVEPNVIRSLAGMERQKCTNTIAVLSSAIDSKELSQKLGGWCWQMAENRRLAAGENGVNLEVSRSVAFFCGIPVFGRKIW